jgi:hypothetical protein
LSIETKTTTKRTWKSFGVLNSAAEFKVFVAALPDNAKIDIRVDKPLRGEFGSTVTIIEAEWDDE